MVGWHLRLNGPEFEQTLGDGEGQGNVVCCILWGCKELDTTEQLNNKNSHYGDRVEGTLFLTKEERTYNGAKIASSISDAGKLDSHLQKNEIRTLTNTIHKDKFKMDKKPKCKARNYKTIS